LDSSIQTEVISVDAHQQRQEEIAGWLRALLPGRDFTLAPASADASFRRYLRATFDDGTTRVIMDAPPSHEDVKPWLHVQRLFHDAGTHVPEVYATDLERGYLLLSDLGSTTYLADLADANADARYRAAIEALIRIQLASRPNELPPYDRVLLKRELDLFPDWYLARHVGLALSESQSSQLASVFEQIMAVNLAEPSVYVHRD
jgi:aminoglycoside/choline kinase family phosphotransferase